MRICVLAVSICATLAACGDVKVPVSGTIGSERAQGQAVGNISGKGLFSATTSSGLQCSGTYNPLSTDPTISAPTTCNDGRTGTLIITRSLDGLSGTAIGQLNDGTKAEFVFGDLVFQQGTGANAGASTR